VCPGPFTHPDITLKAKQFLEEIGQSPIIVKKEVESFILNRLQVSAFFFLSFFSFSSPTLFLCLTSPLPLCMNLLLKKGALLNEAFRLVEDGLISTEDLDKTLKDGLGLRWSFMGPFETVQLEFFSFSVCDFVAFASFLPTTTKD
jgi:hypothetical protein